MQGSTRRLLELNMVRSDHRCEMQTPSDHWASFRAQCDCWILMHETRWPWRPAVRGHKGGAEVCLKDHRDRETWRWRLRADVAAAFEYCVSVAWAFAFPPDGGDLVPAVLPIFRPGAGGNDFPPAFTVCPGGKTCCSIRREPHHSSRDMRPKRWRQIADDLV